MDDFLVESTTLARTFHRPTPHPASPDHWVVRQFDSPETGTGFVQAIRLPASPAATITVQLKGLDPAATYEVDGIAGVRSGKAWMHAGLHLELDDFQSTVRRIRRR